MNILLVAINAKYSHTNLAVRDLQNVLAAEGMEAGIAEYTINQPTREILSDLARRGADTYCFSCYIWNIEYVRRLGADPAAALSGGVHPAGRAGGELRPGGTARGDAVGGRDPLRGGGAADRRCPAGGTAARGPPRRAVYRPWTRCPSLTAISTRSKTGCSTMSRRAGARSGAATACHPPTGRCVTARCRASSTICGGSSTPGVMQVKFVDRTFNLDADRALAIWKFLAEHDNGITGFQMELGGDLLTGEQLAFLSTVRPGLFQFEIGVQSTCGETLAEVCRQDRTSAA